MLSVTLPQDKRRPLHNPHSCPGQGPGRASGASGQARQAAHAVAGQVGGRHRPEPVVSPKPVQKIAACAAGRDRVARTAGRCARTAIPQQKLVWPGDNPRAIYTQNSASIPRRCPSRMQPSPAGCNRRLSGSSNSDSLAKSAPCCAEFIARRHGARNFRLIRGHQRAAAAALATVRPSTACRAAKSSSGVNIRFCGINHALSSGATCRHSSNCRANPRWLRCHRKVEATRMTTITADGDDPIVHSVGDAPMDHSGNRCSGLHRLQRHRPDRVRPAAADAGRHVGDARRDRLDGHLQHSRHRHRNPDDGLAGRPLRHPQRHGLEHCHLHGGHPALRAGDVARKPRPLAHRAGRRRRRTSAARSDHPAQHLSALPAWPGHLGVRRGQYGGPRARSFARRLYRRAVELALGFLPHGAVRHCGVLRFPLRAAARHAAAACAARLDRLSCPGSRACASADRAVARPAPRLVRIQPHPRRHASVAVALYLFVAHSTDGDPPVPQS